MTDTPLMMTPFQEDQVRGYASTNAPNPIAYAQYMVTMCLAEIDALRAALAEAEADVALYRGGEQSARAEAMEWQVRAERAEAALAEAEKDRERLDWLGASPVLLVPPRMGAIVWTDGPPEVPKPYDIRASLDAAIQRNAALDAARQKEGDR